ncbi:MAG: sucrase ferredoxin [Anaerolineales bacterium]
MVEYTDRYENKAFQESTIPDEVKAHLQGVQIPGARTRTQLIRQDGSRDREGLHFFVGITDPQKPRLYEFHLQQYTDILDLDLQNLVAEMPADQDHLPDEPLFLTCTNGKRDLCCARYGPKVYQALAEEVGDSAWQSSHIGGHNKAPNNLFFPHGVNYGRATPEEILHLASEYKLGRVVLNNYRGRVCFTPHVQAAEHFWRQESGVLALPGMQVFSVENVGENEWRVEIGDAEGESQDEICVRRRESEFEIRNSCLKDATSPMSTFHRVG